MLTTQIMGSYATLLVYTLSALLTGQVCGCGYTVKAIDRQQTISSPGFPVGYAQSSDCTWTIQAEYGSHVTINITDFDLGSGDYLRLYDGSSRTVLATYSSMKLDNLPESMFTTKSNTAVVRFTSSYFHRATEHDGFSLHFIMDCQDNAKCTSVGATAACADTDVGETFCPKLCGSCPHLISQLLG